MSDDKPKAQITLEALNNVTKILALKQKAFTTMEQLYIALMHEAVKRGQAKVHVQRFKSTRPCVGAKLVWANGDELLLSLEQYRRLPDMPYVDKYVGIHTEYTIKKYWNQKENVAWQSK